MSYGKCGCPLRNYSLAVVQKSDVQKINNFMLKLAIELQIQGIRIHIHDKGSNIVIGDFPYKEQVVNVTTMPLDVACKRIGW